MTSTRRRRELILAIISIVSGLAALVVLLGPQEIPSIIRKAILGTLPLWAGMLTLLYFMRREDRRRRPGRCAKCGFDLRSIRNRCPECGAPIPPPREHQI